MAQDMTVPWDGGLINIRVGAILLRNGHYLMVNSGRTAYLYSVGGRVQFGETAEEAVQREVLEETGARLEIDRLGFVHENYFYGDAPHNRGKLIYELAFFFYMRVPEDFSPVAGSFAPGERLVWVPVGADVLQYPPFFRTELMHPERTVKYFVNDERKK